MDHACICDCRSLMRWLQRAAEQHPGFGSHSHVEDLHILGDDEYNIPCHQIGCPGQDRYIRIVATAAQHHTFIDVLHSLYSVDQAAALWGELERCRCCERHQRQRPGRPAALLGPLACWGRSAAWAALASSASRD